MLRITTNTPLRVWGLSVNGNHHSIVDTPTATTEWVALMWRALETLCKPCATLESQGSPNTTKKESCLALLGISLCDNERDAKSIQTASPIIQTLMTRFLAATRQLQTLHIKGHNYNEANDFQMLALLERLQDFTFSLCPLRSVKDLPQHLLKVDFTDCWWIQTLEGLQGHVQLQEMNVSGTSIQTIGVLFEQCPALVRIHLRRCSRLHSLDGLQGHIKLQVADASQTPITFVQELLHCPSLVRVYFCQCEHLTNLDGLRGHRMLEEISLAYTPITSIGASLQCPALKKVNLFDCCGLKNLDGLRECSRLEEVCVSLETMKHVCKLLGDVALNLNLTCDW